MLYSDEQLRELLAGAGLVDVDLREAWSEAPYGGGEAMVVLARRSGLALV